MPTHALFFARPLRNIVLVSSHTGKSRIVQNTSGNFPQSGKLTKTGLTELDTNSPPLQEIRELLSKIEQQIKGQAKTQQEFVTQFQELTVQLAIQIASAVVRYEVVQHETRIRQLLETYQTEHGTQVPLVVSVNRTDLEKLRISLHDASSPDSMLQLKQDDSLTTGDCRIESDHLVVANYQRQLADIQMQLMEALDHARVERENTDARDRRS